jgi:CHAT domain-containing protein
LEERQQAIMSQDPKHREMFAALTRLKEQYRKASFAPGEEAQKEAETIRAQLDAAEQEMAGIGAASGTTRRALRVKVEDVQAKLPADALLVEFIHYFDNLRRPAYGAVIIPPTGAAKWVQIGSAKEIDEIVEMYKFISNHIAHPQLMEAASKQLRLRLWEPLEKHFPEGVKRLVLSPDGELCFVSFATLLNAENQFLCEKYDVQYVASGRDLLRQPSKSEMIRSKDTLAIYADPAYLAKADAGSGPRWMPQLPGARKEGDVLKQLGESWHWKVELLLDEQADESSIRSKPAPRILHLSTHGFYFDHMPHPGKQGQEANPMLKSGLALAGAESTFRKWRAGQVGDPSTDGILMADELGDLNLRGTWLVCLSACQTGNGEAKSGEGVMGLRRGFVEAGAQHLISTLWPIPDEQTVPIMKDFYTRVNETQDPPLALSQVQRDWLVKLRKEHNSAGAAIIMAGAFIANSYGKPGT